MQCIVGSPEGKIYSRMFWIYHISLLKLLTCIKRRFWITEKQTRKKSAQYKVKSRRHAEKLKKKSYQSLKYARAYLRKERYAPAYCVDKFSELALGIFFTAAVKHGIRKRKRNHGNGNRNGIRNPWKKFPSDRFEKKNVSNDNKINKQIF